MSDLEQAGEYQPPKHFKPEYWQDLVARHGGVHKAVVGALWPLQPYLLVWGNSGYPIRPMIQEWSNWTRCICEAVGVEPQMVEFGRKKHGVSDYSYLHVFEGAEDLDWRVGLVLGMWDSRCPRCGTGWSIADWHCTHYDRGSGQNVLCERCWGELSPERRLPYYQVVVESCVFESLTSQTTEWADHYGKDGRLLLDACLAGL